MDDVFFGVEEDFSQTQIIQENPNINSFYSPSGFKNSSDNFSFKPWENYGKGDFEQLEESIKDEFNPHTKPLNYQQVRWRCPPHETSSREPFLFAEEQGM